VDSQNATYHTQASLFFLFVYLIRSLTPHDGQDSKPLNKLNLLTVLSRKRTNHTRSTHWPHHSHRLVLLWPGPGEDICEDLNSRVVQVEHLLLAVVALTNLNSNAKEAMDIPCEEDGVVREMDAAGHYPYTCPVSMSAPLQVAWDLGMSSS